MSAFQTIVTIDLAVILLSNVYVALNSYFHWGSRRYPHDFEHKKRAH